MSSFRTVILAVCMILISAAPAYAANGSDQPAGGIAPATPSDAEYEDPYAEYEDSDYYMIRFRDSKSGYTYDMLPWQSTKSSELCQGLSIGNKALNVDSPDTDFIEITVISYTDDEPDDWKISIYPDSTSNEGQLIIEDSESRIHTINVTRIAFETKEVSYKNEDGDIEEQECIIISGKNTYFWFKPGKWYSFENNAYVTERINNFGTEDDPAYLILADKCSLSANGGIENHNGSKLVIYGGKNGNGRLTASHRENGAGIGGSDENCSGGIFTLYGGTLYATGSKNYAGIGGGRDVENEEDGEGGIITVNGGTVHANGGNNAAGIGTFKDAPSPGSITLNENLVILAGSTKSALTEKTPEQYIESRDRYVRITPKHTDPGSDDSYGSESDDSTTIHQFTGAETDPVSGTWTQDSGGAWHFAAVSPFRNTWGYIVNPYAQEGHNTSDWFYFDANGNMLTGWQYINGKWYYLNPSRDGTLGACLIGPGKTPDGYEIDAAGAWTGR